MSKVKFVLDMRERAEAIEPLYLADEHGWRELFPEQIHALFQLKDRVQDMLDEGGERAFTNLVEDAKDLEDTFKNCVRALGLTKRKRRALADY